MRSSLDVALQEKHPTARAWAEPCGVRRRGVGWFLSLAFAGAWIPWYGVYLAGGSLDDPVVQLLTAAFVPALAACVVRRWVTRQGLRDSGMRLHLRTSWRHYAAAVTIPWGVLILAVGIAAVTGMWSPGPTDLDASSWLYLATGPLICIALARSSGVRSTAGRPICATAWCPAARSSRRSSPG